MASGTLQVGECLPGLSLGDSSFFSMSWTLLLSSVPALVVSTLALVSFSSLLTDAESELSSGDIRLDSSSVGLDECPFKSRSDVDLDTDTFCPLEDNEGITTFETMVETVFRGDCVTFCGGPTSGSGGTTTARGVWLEDSFLSSPLITSSVFPSFKALLDNCASTTSPLETFETFETLSSVVFVTALLITTLSSPSSPDDCCRKTSSRSSCAVFRSRGSRARHDRKNAPASG
mmetsp:Transcript_8448/g.14336  ORF Transcript_8448/g.14336 Transcript_8448/m.14336 type:complete len:232 (-) Transcript_8448:1356-2051(-)